MKNPLNIVMAQQNFLVGDIHGNAEKICAASIEARDTLKADVIVFPEMAVCGYPPEDLLFRKDFYRRINAALTHIAEATQGIDVVLGYATSNGTQRYNTAGLIRDGAIVVEYHKQCLPNYSVFDEQRYFTAGTQSTLIDLQGIKVGLLICEDLWHPGPIAQAKAAGAEGILCINASPFDRLKASEREKMAIERVNETQLPILYINCVGGQDELVFDGGSFAISDQGKVQHHAPFCQEVLETVTLSTQRPIQITSQKVTPELSDEERLYQALVLGVRDYIEKNQFQSAIIGLSGGIDSALTLAIAVDAIGADRVEAVMMPSRYTSDMSQTDSAEQTKTLGVEYHVIPIEAPFNAFVDTLSDEFKGLQTDTTEENIQARCRAIILMAISNKKGAIVLSTGNKSELSVGYATLYGDMVGGFCVLKDVPKHWVYRLANYRNQQSPAIPQNVIDRPPSAELAPDQLDQDTLPPYDILDRILELYIEKDKSPEAIIAEGFEPGVVHQVVKMVKRNEYKRHQAPVGVRLSQRAFGKDRRYPITSGY